MGRSHLGLSIQSKCELHPDLGNFEAKDARRGYTLKLARFPAGQILIGYLIRRCYLKIPLIEINRKIRRSVGLPCGIVAAGIRSPRHPTWTHRAKAYWRRSIGARRDRLGG